MRYSIPFVLVAALAAGFSTACAGKTPPPKIVKVVERVPCLDPFDKPPEWKSIDGFICRPAQIKTSMDPEAWEPAPEESQQIEWVCIPDAPAPDAALLDLNISRLRRWAAMAWEACGKKADPPPAE